MKLKVIKPFDWAHQNVRVESFAKGQTIETEDEDLIRVATEEGWVQRSRASSKDTSTDTAAEAESDAGDVSALAGQGTAAAEQAAMDTGPAASAAAEDTAQA